MASGINLKVTAVGASCSSTRAGGSMMEDSSSTAGSRTDSESEESAATESGTGSSAVGSSMSDSRTELATKSTGVLSATGRRDSDIHSAQRQSIGESVWTASR